MAKSTRKPKPAPAQVPPPEVEPVPVAAEPEPEPVVVEVPSASAPPVVVRVKIPVVPPEPEPEPIVVVPPSDLSSLAAMRAYLQARHPDGVTPVEQILLDLGVYDGMPLPAVDGSLVAKVQRKLDAATHRTASFYADACTVDYVGASVGIEHTAAGAVLRIAVTRVA